MPGYTDRTRIVVWLPKDLHRQVRQLTLLNQRSMTEYVIRGLRHVLQQAAHEWPREYFDSLAEKAEYERSVRPVRRRYAVTTGT